MARSEAVGKPLSEIFSPELLAELPPPSDRDATLSLYKFRLRTPSGRERVVNLSLTPLVGKEGRVIGRLVILNDLTERVELEDQLVQAEKLSSIGLLAAGVAHEVNTPLAVITSQAQMLMRQVPADDPSAKTLDRIIKQSFRASEIVNSLLKFSRMGGSEYSEVDLNRVIRETLALVEPMLRASKITLNTQLVSGLPGVHGNHGRLQQVFMNLIMNARDAMPYGGELTLATESEDSTVRVEVNPVQLANAGIALEDVRAAIAAANANRPKGAVESSGTRLQIYTNDQGITAADYRGLPGKCHEALVLHRPDVIEGVHESMVAAASRCGRSS